MPKKPDVPCAGGCGRLCWRHPTSLPPGQQMCRECRTRSRGGVMRTCGQCGKPSQGQTCARCLGWTRNHGLQCNEAGCVRPARSRGLCKTHYNRATGHYIGDVAKDQDRERARLRIKTHRRKDWSRLTDITPEYELGLRAKAKRCPLCRAKLTDEPYLPHSKELDHLVPRGVGGTHTIGNVRITCRSCNLARPKNGSDYRGPVTLWAEAI